MDTTEFDRQASSSQVLPGYDLNVNSFSYSTPCHPAIPYLIEYITNPGAVESLCQKDLEANRGVMDIGIYFHYLVPIKQNREQEFEDNVNNIGLAGTIE